MAAIGPHKDPAGRSLQFPWSTPALALVVDDQGDARDALKSLIESGMPEVRVVTADRPLEALAAVGVLKPAVAIADLRLDGMDGVQFLSELRRVSPAAKRVLITPGRDASSLARAVNDAAVHAIVLDPLKPNELVGEIRRVLADARRPFGRIPPPRV